MPSALPGGASLRRLTILLPMTTPSARFPTLRKWSRVFTPNPTAMGILPAYFLTRAQSSGKDRDIFPVAEDPVTPIRDTTYMKESAIGASDCNRELDVAGATRGT